MPRSPLILALPAGLLTACLAAACLAACGGDTGAAVSPVTTPASSVATRSIASSGDEAGRRACDLLKQAIEGATLMNPGVVQAVRSASTSADAPVSDAAERLVTAYTAAVAAHGHDDEPDAIAAVSTAGAQMKRTCTDAGLDTAG